MALDGATRELYEEICRSPKYTRLIHALDEAVPADSGCPRPAIVLVPGILYRDYPRTGADGAAVRALAGAAGAAFHTIPTDGTAGLDAGAAQVVDWLVNRQGSRPCILVSLSKGSAEVRVALEHPRAREAFAGVRAWISVSGLPLGTPSFEYILSGPVRGTWLRGLCCWKGWSLAQLRDLLRHRPDARLRAPEHLAVVHVVAFPQHAHSTLR